MLAEIATGVLVDVIAATGRWIATSTTSAVSAARAGLDAEVAAWFDTYELTGRELPDLAVPDDQAARWLDGNDVHAVLHELLAMRLTDAPELDVERARGALRELAWAEFAPPETAASGLEASLVLKRADDVTRAQTDTVADRIFDWADGEICELVAKFEARDPQRWRGARADAFGARIVALLGAIDRHIAALGDRPDPAADAEWADRYRRQAVQAYGSIEPPDFARRRKVPIVDLYVPPRIVEPGAARDADGNPSTIGFDDLAARIDRTVLLGDPGGGKSTASRVLAYRWAMDLPALVSGEAEVRCLNCGTLIARRFCAECGAARPGSAPGEQLRPPGRSRVPFLVVLRDFAAGAGPRRSVVEHIEERLNTFHQCAAPDGTVERLLLSGAAVVIFDGLDELLDPARRVEVTRIVEQFCTRFPLASVLVTSRIVGYDEARLDDTQFGVYRIAGFTRDRTGAYVRKWFAQEEGVDTDEAGRLAAAFMRESEHAADLRSNPLMLALMCILYRGEGSLPRNRPGVYAECARMLFDKWETRRGIHVHLRARKLIEPALRYIAYWLFTRDGSPEVTGSELISRVADVLYERGFERRHDAEAAAEEFVEFCRGRAWILGDVGTTGRGEPLYTFIHRTFLEYFAAAHLATVNDTPEDLARELLSPVMSGNSWDMVGQLAIQIKNAGTDRGAERALTELLRLERQHGRGTSDPSHGRVLAFAARCLDVAEVPPALVRRIANRAFDRLDDGPGYAVTYLPLWQDDSREIITEVARERVTALIASDDPADRTRGMRFCVNAASFTAGGTSWAHWRELERELVTLHRDALIQAARTDDAVWMRLWERNVLSMAEALRLRGHRIDVLFREVAVPFTDLVWPPFAAQAVLDLSDFSGYQPQAGSRTAIRTAFGETLPEMPDPPWPVSRPGISEMMFARPHPGIREQAPAEPAELLGMAVLLAVVAELLDADSPVVVETLRTGPMHVLAPYLMRRVDDALVLRSPELPDLPLPDRFTGLFLRWAHRELDFVQWRHGDEPG